MSTSGFLIGAFGLLIMITLPVVILVAVLVWWARQRSKERQRSHEYAQYAASRGWSFTADASALRSQFAESEPFKSQPGGQFLNAFGFYLDGRPAFSFEFRYRYNSGKQTVTQYLHVVSMELPAALPHLVIQREGPGRAIAELLGMGDIQFESEEFNRRWNITSSNSAFAHEVINPQMMSWLMQPEVSGANFTIDRHILFTTLNGVKQDIHKIDGVGWFLKEFHSRIPGFVWQKAGGSGK